jgi:hypothetical protein
MPKAKRPAKKGASNAGKQQKRKHNGRAGMDTRDNIGLQKVKLSARGVGSGLSRCAQLYAKALVNPWSDFDELPCVPTSPSDLTYRFRAVFRGSFSTQSSNGCGFMGWACRNPANNVNLIYSSTAASTASTPSTPFAVSAPGLALSMKATLPYPAAPFNLNPPLAGRLVASGMRIRSTTSPMTRQGSLLFCRANGGSLHTITAAGLNASPDNVKQTIDADSSEWLLWNYHPDNVDDYNFPEGQVDYTVLNTGIEMGVYVQGASTTNPSTFDYEIVEFWEFAGQAPGYSLPSVTRSHADPVGLARVAEAVAVPPQDLTLRGLARHTSEAIVEQMAHSDSVSKTLEDVLGLAGLALPAVSRIVSSLTGYLLQ